MVGNFKRSGKYTNAVVVPGLLKWSMAECKNCRLLEAFNTVNQQING
jgi:hypothetical protein